MRKIKAAWNMCDRRIAELWMDTPEFEGRRRRKGSRREQFGGFLLEFRLELLFVLLMGCLLFGLSWVLPFNAGPDEEMRYLVPMYIYRHGTLPAGYDPEIRHHLWGISYAFHPILPYIFGGWLMRFVSLFSRSEHALLMAARLINVLLGMGFYWYVLRISKVLFSRRIFRFYFVALLALLPQLLYLFTYVNTDAVAMFSTAMIIYYWLDGLKHRWDRRSCTGLAAGIAVCALSYFNAYGYALFSVVLFVGSLCALYAKWGAGPCIRLILKRGIYITVLVFLLTGWWFIRCAILYDGDFLGWNATDYYGELYAIDELKPSNKLSLQEQGVPFSEMLANEEDGGMDWIRTTWRSSIGYFGFFEHALGIDIYEIHKRLLGLGLTGVFLRLLLGCLQYVRRWMCRKTRFGRSGKQTRQECTAARADGHGVNGGGTHNEIRGIHFLLLQFSFGCCIIIPVILSMYHSYCQDFQPQGRYVMPLVIPLMYFTANGTERFLTLFFRKWFVPLLMIPIFWAVVHVFLGAFVSVYLPVYCETLAGWADIRFWWFSHSRVIANLIQFLIPG